MKVTQMLKHRRRELYILGLKLIFIYAEYNGPALFESLINLGIAKVLQSLGRIKLPYNWQGRQDLNLNDANLGTIKFLSGLQNDRKPIG